MDQRRHSCREASFADALIVRGDGHSDIPCVVDNVSEGGVRLRILPDTAVPDDFDLVYSADGEACRCHTVWRREDQVGAAFVNAEAAGRVHRVSPASAAV